MTFVIPAAAPVSVPVLSATVGQSFPVRRIYCVGRNYAEHAIEMGFTGREAPFFFMKPADAVLVVPPNTTGRMHYPTLTKNLHYEAELVVAIGMGGRNIRAADALQHVWGYAVGLDMTRRDLQTEMKQQGRPWCIAKGFDESAPIGPVVPAAQCTWSANSRIELAVNGVTRQSSTLGHMIWSVAEVIEHLSAAWILAPGDLIYTGTPENVGAVAVGDVLTASIAGVGDLAVSIVEGVAS